MVLFLFFFKDTATTEIYTYCHTLSLHDALPIWPWRAWRGTRADSGRPGASARRACGRRVRGAGRGGSGRWRGCWASCFPQGFWVCSLPCEGRGGLGRGAFGVIANRGHRDRKSVVSGKSVSVRVDLGGRRIIKKKKR